MFLKDGKYLLSSFKLVLHAEDDPAFTLILTLFIWFYAVWSFTALTGSESGWFSDLVYIYLQ